MSPSPRVGVALDVLSAGTLVTFPTLRLSGLTGRPGNLLTDVNRSFRLLGALSSEPSDDDDVSPGEYELDRRMPRYSGIFMLLIWCSLLVLKERVLLVMVKVRCWIKH